MIPWHLFFPQTSSALRLLSSLQLVLMILMSPGCGHCGCERPGGFYLSDAVTAGFLPCLIHSSRPFLRPETLGFADGRGQACSGRVPRPACAVPALSSLGDGRLRCVFRRAETVSENNSSRMAHFLPKRSVWVSFLPSEAPAPPFAGRSSLGKVGVGSLRLLPTRVRRQLVSPDVGVTWGGRSR